MRASQNSNVSMIIRPTTRMTNNHAHIAVLRASQNSNVSMIIRPTTRMTPALTRCLHTASSDEAKEREMHARSQTRALCCTVRRTRPSLYIEEKPVGGEPAMRRRARDDYKLVV